MAARCGLFALVVLWSLRISPENQPKQVVIWDVGQGQWTTFIDERNCWHIDSGGEKAPWTSIQQACRQKQNRFAFSHWDWDHISFAIKASQRLHASCVLLPPHGHGSKRKMALFRKLKECSQKAPFDFWQDDKALSSNDLSRVFLWQRILLPGDSSKKEEKLWVNAFKNLRSVRWLILGHHGSHTSTSEQLLNQLPAVYGAIASARQHKYGHPHPSVRASLNRHRIPLLTTEEWGSLHIYL